MFLYCFIKLSYCKITLKTKKQKYNFSKYNHPGIFAQKGEMLKTAELADLRRKKSARVCEFCGKLLLRQQHYSLSTQTKFLSPKASSILPTVGQYFSVCGSGKAACLRV